MATRQQTGGFTPSHPSRSGGGGVVRPVYEEFTPMTERKQQEQSQLLLVNLPGFVKEQVKVSIEGKNTLRVRGERLVGGNKWSQFQEDFHIPEECNISGIRAKFEGGILTITLPNKTGAPAQVGPKKQEAKTPDRQPAPRPGDQLPPKTISTVTEAKKTDGKGITEEPSSRKVAAEPSITQMGKGETPPRPVSSAAPAKPPVDGKGVVDLTSAARIIPDTTETEERSRGKLTSAAKIIPDTTETEERSRGKLTSAAKIIPDSNETKEMSQGKGKLAEIKTPEIVALEKAERKEKETVEKGKESVKPENFPEKIVRKEKEEIEGTASVQKGKIPDFSDVTKQRPITDDMTSGGGGGGGSGDGFTHRYQQTMKELIAKGGNLNDERQLLINMSTAVLVILALGVYISYTIGGGSSGKTKN